MRSEEGTVATELAEERAAIRAEAREEHAAERREEHAAERREEHAAERREDLATEQREELAEELAGERREELVAERHDETSTKTSDITKRALKQRISRKLAPGGIRFREFRDGTPYANTIGRFYSTDANNHITDGPAGDDLETIGRDLKVLGAHEKLAA